MPERPPPATRGIRRQLLRPAQAIVAAFAGVILIGTAVLMLPVAK
jgi:hypothetical protein